MPRDCVREGSFTFQLELGLLVRRAVVFQIQSAAEREDLGVQVLKGDGLLSSVHQFKITGPDDRLSSFVPRLNAYLRQLQASE